MRCGQSFAGLLITDNTIWSGKAARPAPEEDKDTKGVQEFNRMVYASPEGDPVLIPLRDGLYLLVSSWQRPGQEQLSK